MYKFLVNNGQRLAFGLGVLITAIFLFSVIGGLQDFNALPEEDQVTTNIFNFGLSGAIALTVIAAVAMLLFGLFQVFGSFKSSLRGILGFVLLVVVFIIAYSTANGDAANEAAPISNAIEKVGGINAGGLKFIGGSITTALILIVGAFAAFILSEIRNFFK